jgi:probable O-glycosylation ligase (exosortase A-associated)
MRDIVLTLFIAGLLPVCLARPWIGILAWTWVGLMVPQMQTWGFARGIPFALIIAVVTLIGVLFSKDRKGIPWTRETVMLALLWGMFLLTTIFAIVPERAWEQLEKVSKILLFVFLTLMFFQDRTRLRYLFLVTALSLAFYGVKGGIFALATGGIHRVYGPATGFFASNNSIGLALNTIIPILFFLAKDEERRWLRLGLRAAFWLSAIAVVFTYSRGAFLGLLVVMAMLYLKGRWAIVALVAAVVLYVVVTPYLPERLTNRMASIETRDDRSVQNRLAAMEVAWKVAVDRPLLGAGFWGLANRLTYAKYGYVLSISAHDMYLDVLADHGFIAFGIFMSLLLSCLWSLLRLRQMNRGSPDRAWVVRYSLMLEACLIAYMANAVFQSAAYTDLLYLLIGAVILLRTVAALPVPAAAPTRAVPATAVPSRGAASRVPGPVVRRPALGASSHAPSTRTRL